jgi:hypothetical protein
MDGQIDRQADRLDDRQIDRKRDRLIIDRQIDIDRQINDI